MYIKAQLPHAIELNLWTTILSNPLETKQLSSIRTHVVSNKKSEES